MAKESGCRKFSYLLAGVCAGVVVGMLFAPKSGEATRELIAGKTRDGARWLTDQSTDLNKTFQEMARQARRGADRLARAGNGLGDKLGLA